MNQSVRITLMTQNYRKVYFMSGETISVIMACYNGDKLTALKEAIDSVLRQTIPFLEFIIVVDGPVAPPILKCLKEFESLNEKIIVIRLDKNVGGARARNIGMKASQGDYIAIMDSDDIIYPERLECQLEAIKENEADAVWAWQEEFYDGTYEYAGLKTCPELHSDIVRKLKFRNSTSDPTTFIKRICFEKTGGYGNYKNINYDYEFFLKIALSNFKLYCVQKPLIKVRISPAQRARRGGVEILKQDFKLRRWMLKKKILTFPEFIIISGIWAAFRMQPNFVRDFLYKNILRAS